jgi:hypothetical protein
VDPGAVLTDLRSSGDPRKQAKIVKVNVDDAVVVKGGPAVAHGHTIPRAEMNRPFRTSIIGWHIACTGLLLLGVVWMMVDAWARRTAQQERNPHVQSIVRLLGVADLALSSSSRWLRHPSVTEPGAPFADGPAILDNDPAGAVIGPPHAARATVEHRRLSPEQAPDVR